MKFENLQKLSGRQFRRVTGVKQKTFEVMVGILEKAHKEKHARSGYHARNCQPLIAQREEARIAKDWTRADALRKQLQELGVEVKDTKS